MATQAMQFSGRAMSTGRVFQRAFATIRHNPVVTLGLAFLFGALPSAGVQFLLAAMDSTAPADPPVSTMLIQMLMMTALFGLVSALSQAVLTPSVLAEAEDRRARFAESLRAVTALFGSLVALALLTVGIGAIGFMLLIVPGLILWVIWSAAVPVLITERCGTLRAMRRSAELTKGARGAIFGLLLLVGLASGAITAGVEAMTGQLGGKNAWSALTDPVYLSVTLLTGTVMSAVSATVAAALYVELREWKEGPAADRLEEVFA